MKPTDSAFCEGEPFATTGCVGYLVNDFESDLTERCLRVLVADLDENDWYYMPWLPWCRICGSTVANHDCTEEYAT